MNLSPLLIFWLLVLGALAITAVAIYRPRFVPATAVISMVAVWLTWFFLGQRLPLFTAKVVTSPFLSLWQFDDLSWNLSGVWLLLVTAVWVAMGGWRRLDTEQPIGTKMLLPGVMSLAAGGLLPLLAGNLAASMVATIFMVGVWSTVLWLTDSQIHEDITRLLPHAVWLMLSLLFIWLAATFSRETDGNLNMRSWPTMATSSVLTASLLQMGFWPFHGWRSQDWQLPGGAALLIYSAPALAGFSLLARLATSNDVSRGYSLWLTAFGLLGLLVSLRRAWTAPSSRQLAPALSMAQASLAGLALVWVGAEAITFEARVLVLATGAIFLSLMNEGDQPLLKDYSIPARLSFVALLVALGAMIGLPWSSGFVGRAGLYTAWLADDRYVLIVVTTLLLILWVAVVLLASVKLRLVSEKQVAENEENRENRPLQIAIVLLTAGVISIPGLAGVPLLVWITLLIIVVGSVSLAYFVGEVETIGGVLQRAFVLGLPLAGFRRHLKRSVDWLETAVQDAVAIWEGEGGVLWLLVLMIVLFVAGA